MDGFGLSSTHSAVKSLVGRLTDVLSDQVQLLGGLRREVQFIRDEMESMNGFLLNHARKGRMDHQLQAWMNQVKDLANHSQYCVDQYLRCLGTTSHRSPGGLWGSVRRLPRFVSTLPARYRLAIQIQDIKIRVVEVSQRQQRYPLHGTATEQEPQSGMASDRSQQAFLTGDSEADQQEHLRRRILAEDDSGLFKEAADELTSWLTVEGDGRSDLRIVPIVGSRGMGKTTLAEQVYKGYSSRLADQKAWISVGSNQSPQQVLRDILAQIVGLHANNLQDMGTWGNSQIALMIQEQLEGKRFLIVLDDVCSESLWKDIEAALHCGNSAPSAILVTTSLPEVAQSFCPYRIYDLRCIQEEHNRSLVDFFLVRAANLISDSGHGKAGLKEEVLRSILVKCSPCIFSMKMLLRFLYANPNKTLQELHDFGNSLCFCSPLHLSSWLSNAEKMLTFCYNALPCDYRSCLLYLTIFPNDHNIRRTSLLRRWIAEGLIAERDGLSAFDVANRCFDALLAQRFVLPGDIGNSGKVNSCRVHNLVRDFIAWVIRDDNFVYTKLPVDLAHRLPIHNGERLQQVSRIKLRASHFNDCWSMTRCCFTTKSVDPLAGISMLLRSIQESAQLGLRLNVLDLEGCKGLEKYHLNSICKIFQLKYLSLRNTDVSHLPKKIDKLQYLETLDIRQTQIKAFPGKNVILPGLKHLLAGCSNCPSKKNNLKEKESCSFSTVLMPRKIVRMGKLEILCYAEVSSGLTGLMGICQLRRLRKLGVLLQGNAACNLDYLFRQIDMLDRSLHSLSIRMERLKLAKDDARKRDDMVPASFPFSPPKFVQKLNISGIRSALLGWIGDLHQLSKITLHETSLTEHVLGILGQLGSLRCLKLQCNSTMGSSLSFRSGAFRNLVALVVQDNSLLDIIFDYGAAPRLERVILSIAAIDSLSGVQHLQQLKELELHGSARNIGEVEQAIAGHHNNPVFRHEQWNDLH
ncbi:disease resistance protein Pik-2-like [Oryza glaberrima]|uniref:NB-ARC domain-containing protein n=2 Tax=Oryza TaxID=4527 RepID=A0A0D3HPJ2_9ORYZ|nr:disease resistance protein Pik-2-like [Oryza glaberrima]